jgi:predicted ATPase
MVEVRRLPDIDRPVALTGAGGIEKTRMAVQIAATIIDQYGGGVRYVDLAPITDPDTIPWRQAPSPLR